MRLTQWTDYALRVLMYCATHQNREIPPTIAEIAQVHCISRSHLMKVVMELSAKGWLVTTRGRGGGLRLVKNPSEIIVGDVVRQMEEDFTMVECFSTEGRNCIIDGRCRLKGLLSDALQAWMRVLDRVTLAELVTPQERLTGYPLERLRPQER